LLSASAPVLFRACLRSKRLVENKHMPRKPSLRKNIAALYAVQFSSYVAPLATLPWLTRVLGPSGFGRLSFCVAVTSYFVLFADYGFNLSATRQIAVHWNDRAGRSRIFWNTMAVKALLAAAGLPCLLLLTLFVHRLGQERPLLLINYLAVLGAVLTPTWYFLGTERQAILGGITIAVRIISVPAIFLLVRSNHDVLVAALIPSGMTVVGGLLCLAFLMKQKQLDRIRINRCELVAVLADGWHLFVSTASISLYQATNTMALGFMAGNAAVGHYSAAEKLIQACQGLLVPISQSVYPRVSRLMQQSRAAAFALIRRVLRVQGSAAFVISLLLFLFASPLIRSLYGPDYEETTNVLRWLAMLPFLIGLSNVFGVQTMLALGMNMLVSRILIIAGVLNVVALLVLTQWFGAVGAAMAVAGTELFVTIVMGWIVRRRNLPVFRIPAAT
jgi:polysaccharide transporter, PST family